MNVLIDWFSFTVRKPESIGDYGPLYKRMTKHVVDRSLGVPFNQILFWPSTDKENPSWVPDRGRPPYTDSIRNPISKTVAFLNPGLDHILIEMSGQSCAWHEERDELYGIIDKYNGSCTRIDITCDIECSVAPSDFVAQRSGVSTIESVSVSSATGHSEYIGSPSSQRRAVVYRFNHPHPRSGFLRVEHRHKQDLAKIVASYLSKHGKGKTLAAVAAPYRWEHPAWNLQETTTEPLPPYTSKFKDGGKLKWVLSQVFPALRKYEQEGTIPNLRQFCEEHLFLDGGNMPE